MGLKKFLFIVIVFIDTAFLYASSLKEQLRQMGYQEMCDKQHGSKSYDILYAYFDEVIKFLQANPVWAQKLYTAKERFIRSKNRNYYSTNFFGFYDESKRRGRNQISFYYSVHFHDFIFSYYPEFKHIVPIIKFFECCFEIQQSSRNIFNDAVSELNIESIFLSDYGEVPILLKVVKYLPSYSVSRPHYDGSALSLFLDSTDNQSLLFSVYRPIFMVDDFVCPVRKFERSYDQNSIMLIPGTFLTEFFFYPTPHIVEQTGKTRYATVAFAMRPHYIFQKNNFPVLPIFNS